MMFNVCNKMFKHPKMSSSFVRCLIFFLLPKHTVIKKRPLSERSMFIIPKYQIYFFYTMNVVNWFFTSILQPFAIITVLVNSRLNYWTSTSFNKNTNDRCAFKMKKKIRVQFSLTWNHKIKQTKLSTSQH